MDHGKRFGPRWRQGWWRNDCDAFKFGYMYACSWISMSLWYVAVGFFFLEGSSCSSLFLGSVAMRFPTHPVACLAALLVIWPYLPGHQIYSRLHWTTAWSLWQCISSVVEDGRGALVPKIKNSGRLGTEVTEHNNTKVLIIKLNAWLPDV